MVFNEVMQQREDRYRSINPSCGTIDYYDKRKGKILSNQCMRFSCGRCRNKAINNKLRDVVKASYDYKLNKHFVITLEGHNFRDYIDADASFKYLAKKWNNFRANYYRACKKRFNYIAFFRSQQDGYAHMHILVDKYIPWEWIEDTLRYMNLGWARINYVNIHRVKNYLSKYWYKEHEWFIPENKKHFATSRSIKLDKYKPSGYDYFLLTSEFDYINPFWKLECYYDRIQYETFYPPPFEFIIAEFYDKIVYN